MEATEEPEFMQNFSEGPVYHLREGDMENLCSWIAGETIHMRKLQMLY